MEIINEEASRFVDETYWQKVTTTAPSSNCEDPTRKRNGSDSELMRSRNQSLLAKNMNQSEIRKETKKNEQPDIVFPDPDNNKLPYTIHVLNRSNEMCGICNKKVRTKPLEKDKEKESE